MLRIHLGFGVTLDTLEGMPPRLLKFGRALGTNTVIRATMQRRGLTPEVVEEMWPLPPRHLRAAHP